MKHKKIYFNRGFSVAETLVVLSILVPIVFVLSTFQKDVFSLNSSLQGGLTAQFEGGKVMRSMVAELRSMSPSAAGAYPIAQVATSTITFYADVDNDSSKEQVRYFMSSGTLKRGVIDPTGNPPVYTSAEKVSTLITSVVNNNSTPIFYYYNSAYTGATSPLAMPVDQLVVRLVKINVIIDKDVNRPPGPINVTSQVSLRNLKDNL